jgi:PAS domain S-box-containing protein
LSFVPSGAKRTEPADSRGALAAEESLAEFLENAPVGLHSLDPHGRILWANRAELELFGYAPEEYVGHNIAEFHADAEVIIDILARMARNEPVQGYEARMRCKDGSLRHVLISSNVLRRNGSFVQTRSFTRDISDRKRAEEALRASERQFRAVFETARDAIIIADDEGCFLEVNQAACETFGRERHELLGRRALDFAAPGLDFPSAGQRFLSAVTESGEYVLLRPDGTRRELEYNATANFVPGRHVSVLRDVTDRHRGQRLLAIRHAVATLLSGAPVLPEGVPGMLQAVCEGLGWDMGAVWLADRQAGDLYCLGAWEAEWLRGRPFARVTRERRFAPGVGLPGRVFASGAHAWIADIQADDNFPRALMAREAGLHGGSAYPLSLGGERLGVVEFFSRDLGKLDDTLATLMGDLASHFASYLVRTRVQQELRESEGRYRLLVEHAPDGFGVAADGRLVFINPAGLRLLGAAEPEDVIGRELLGLVAPEDRDRVAALIRGRGADGRGGGSVPVPAGGPRPARVARRDGRAAGRGGAAAAARGRGGGSAARGDRQPPQGRVPGHALPRAADAPLRDRGLDAPAPLEPARRRHDAARAGHHRAQRQGPDAAHRGPARRLAYRYRKAAARRAAGGAGGRARGRARLRAPRGRGARAERRGRAAS